MAKNLTGCEKPLKIVICGINKEKKKAVFFNPPCKQWDCEYCQANNRDWWIHRSMKGTLAGLERGLEYMFVTLTSRHYATTNSSLYFFKQNWPKLSRRAKYHTEKIPGAQWQFLLIPERTQAGILHAHLIAATPLLEKWWKDNAHSCGFGYIADCAPIKNAEKSAWYVSKYLGKDVVHTGWPKGFRRARTSRNWPKSTDIKPIDWQYSKHSEESAWFEYYLLKDYGYEVTDKR